MAPCTVQGKSSGLTRQKILSNEPGKTPRNGGPRGTLEWPDDVQFAALANHPCIRFHPPKQGDFWDVGAAGAKTIPAAVDWNGDPLLGL